MKPRTLNILKKLANQRLNLLQQDMVRLQGEREAWQHRINQVGEQALSERSCTDVIGDAFFVNLAKQRNDYLAEITRLDLEIQNLQKQVVEAWQKEEMLKILK